MTGRGYNGRIRRTRDGGGMSVIRIPYTEEQKRRDQEHQKDVEWFNKNHRELMKRYPEQWVAVLGQKVVGAALDVYDLIARLKEKGIAQDVILWEQMTEAETIITDVYDPNTDEWQMVITTFRWNDDFRRI